MEKEKIIKLLKHLHPTEEISNFMCNDFYVELQQILPLKFCINSNNIKNENRKVNLLFAKQKVKEFLNSNHVYKQMIKQLNITNSIEEILIGYVFVMSKTSKEFENVDIFKDKKSICYNILPFYNIF